MSKYFKIGILLSLVWWAQSALAQDTIPLNTTYSFEVNNVEGYTYTWWFTNDAGVITELESTTYKTEEYYWDTEGEFQIMAQAKDVTGCLSDIIFKDYVVIDTTVTVPLIVNAGPDTLIGSCNPYQLEAWVSDPTGLTYLWSPGKNLDDPTILNPTFIPDITTTFILSVANSSGVLDKDTVTIEVADVYANAGEDLVIEKDATAMLDGSASSGVDIRFLWTTLNGSIDSGENTAYPIVSSTGTYKLMITDFYGCVETDSVVVDLLTYAPIANDDYDTTSYQTAVNIRVLDNDEAPGGDLDPSSLEIVEYPLNGSAYINYNDYTVTYTPYDGFIGSDVFEYKICNLTNKCDNALVYVLVSSVDFLIPEAFTPNGDNINDYFEIKGIEYYPGNSITIINRWGNMVYEAKNYGIDTNPTFWDGKWADGSGNKNVPTGTYFYVLDLGNGKKPIAGSIYIDR